MNSLRARSGGFFYHYLALKYRGSLWRSFKEQLQHQLHIWNPKKSHLVWIGSSGGYCIDLNWIRQFQRITVYEIDPLARWILEQRIGHPNIQFKSTNLLRVDGDLSVEPLKEEIKNLEPRETAFLFSNVLGQLPADGMVHDYPEFLKSLKATLKAHNWASFHDRISTAHRPTSNGAIMNTETGTTPEVNDLVRRYFTGGHQNLEIVDHMTGALGDPNHPSKWIWWQLSPSDFHLIEWVSYSK